MSFMSTICKSIYSAHKPTVIFANSSTFESARFKTHYAANVATVLPFDNADSSAFKYAQLQTNFPADRSTYKLTNWLSFHPANNNAVSSTIDSTFSTLVNAICPTFMYPNAAAHQSTEWQAN